MTEFQLTEFQLTEFQFTLFQLTLVQVTGSSPVQSSWLAVMPVLALSVVGVLRAAATSR